ncbi:MAG: sigma 54-interacting transcriptional regulator [Tissierellia bacterium]|nr:sigma 54-interacting transcriptional regulator [Tissierellia bacterium]
MSYLRWMQDTLQHTAMTLSSALNVDVVIADEHLTRIVGTGDFSNRLDEDCADDSLFANVIRTGQPQINLKREDSDICKNCSNRANCDEHANITYPIKPDGKVIGLVSFASFNEKQRETIDHKRYEYFNMLKYIANMIESEIVNIKVNNRMKRNIAEVNEIINCLNKGIIILNSNMEIIHVNTKALKTLSVDLSYTKIIDCHINTIIEDIKLEDTHNKDIVGSWKIGGKDIRVIYNIGELHLANDQLAFMISFDRVKEIMDAAKSYRIKEDIVFSNIIGNSEPLLQAINKAKIVAETDTTVLLQGASGSGKELFARSIHNESLRSEGPFVVINCASLPENIIESELFGYEQGAFTGASPGGKKGKIELANNGTLFLDEIGDFPLHLQTRLLRVLQERQIDRVGGSKPIDVNIRIISATNRDLETLVKEKKFRLDLFYRLNVVPIVLPDLKDREEDVFICSEYIIGKVCNRMNKEPKSLSDGVKKAFLQYHWPGNIRELENVLEHGICFATGNEIMLEDLPEYFLNNKFPDMSDRSYRDEALPNIDRYADLVIDQQKNLEQLKRDFEKKIISELIETYGDSVDGKKMVSKKLDIGLTTLYRKMNEYQI